MAPIIAAGVLAIELAGGAVERAPRPVIQQAEARQPAARRSPLARLGRALRRAGSLEPALSMRVSGWGIRERSDERGGPLPAPAVLPEPSPHQ